MQSRINSEYRSNTNLFNCSYYNTLGNMALTFEHYHCPLGCEKPQPMKGRDGKIYCGRCWFIYNERITECFLCTPETCDDED